MKAATTKPRAAVSLMARTPWPPRPWRLKRSVFTRLPKPVSVTTSRSASSRTTSRAIALSSPLQLDAAHAAGVAAHLADLVLVEADRHAPVGDDHQVVVAAGGDDPHDLVAVAQVDGDQALAPRLVVLAEGGLLHLPLAVAKTRNLSWSGSRWSSRSPGSTRSAAGSAG